MAISSEVVLASLVAVLSVLTALAAYQGSLADSQESDMNVEGQKQLTEANSLYLEANQFVIYDYTMYDGWYINAGKDEEIAQYYVDSFSEELTANIDRDTDLFDEQYYEEMYAEAESTYDEAMTYFDEAQIAGDRADRMQGVVVIFAVGLALAAYGSMMGPEKMIRFVFTLAAIAALVGGLISFLMA